MTHSGYAAYQEAQAYDVDQAKLILMMFSGSKKFLNKAVEVADTDSKTMEKNVSKAKKVILELISSLNIDNSGEMGEILLKAYKGLFIKLNVAYVEYDVTKIIEVRDSLEELGESWKKIFQSPEYQEFKLSRERQFKKLQISRR